MANREALRELQSRLAAKLEASKEGSMAASWLAVEAAGVRYLIPLRQAGEIFPMPHLQAVAHTQPWFRGVANLRGGLYGVVDFGGFSHPQGHAAGRDAPPGDARLVTLNGLLEFNCALLFDRLWGLRGPEAFTRQDAPAGGAPAWFGQCYTDTTEQPWQEINLQSLCAQDAFVQIRA